MSATYHELTLDAKNRLERAGVFSAALEARLIVERASGKSRDELLRDSRLYADAERAERLEELLARRLAGEPLAYILGEWQFMGRTFEITRDTLIPRSDTETLCARALELLPPGGTLLDLCAGSGCIGLSALAERDDCRAALCELSKPAMAVAKRNARRLGVSARAFFISADATEPLPEALGQFDVIVSNPPYIPRGELASLDASVRDYEPPMALDGGEDGLDFYRAFAKNLKPALKSGGAALFEVGDGESDAVGEIFRAAGWLTGEPIRDLSGRERVIKCGLDKP